MMHAVACESDQPEVLGSAAKGQWQVISLRIPAGLSWFTGHFPDLPLLPGVVQTQWAVEFGRRHFDLPGQFVAMSNMKFMRFIMPGAHIDLHLRYTPARGELQFEYREGDAVCASGRFRFA